MTVKAWWEQEGVVPKTYYYWLRKVRERSLENVPVPAGSIAPVAVPPVELKKLEIRSPASGMKSTA